MYFEITLKYPVHSGLVAPRSHDLAWKSWRHELAYRGDLIRWRHDISHQVESSERKENAWILGCPFKVLTLINQSISQSIT